MSLHILFPEVFLVSLDDDCFRGMATNEKDLKDKAVRLLEIHYGEDAAKLYKNFYEDKSGEVVRQSLFELLGELLGADKAQEQIDKFLK